MKPKNKAEIAKLSISVSTAMARDTLWRLSAAFIRADIYSRFRNIIIQNKKAQRRAKRKQQRQHN